MSSKTKKQANEALKLRPSAAFVNCHNNR